MILGAFGTHALKGRPGITDSNVHAWGTATHYLVCLHLFCVFISDLCADYEWPWVTRRIPAPQVLFPPFFWICYFGWLCSVFGQYHGSRFVQEVCMSSRRRRPTDKFAQVIVPRPHNTTWWHGYDCGVSRHPLFGRPLLTNSSYISLAL